MQKVAEIELQDREGNQLVAERVVGRGDAIHLLSGGNLYRVGVGGVLSILESSSTTS